MVTVWIAQTQAERAAAEARLGRSAWPRSRMTGGQIAALVAALGDVLDVLRDADPAERPRSTGGSGCG